MEVVGGFAKTGPGDTFVVKAVCISTDIWRADNGLLCGAAHCWFGCCKCRLFTYNGGRVDGVGPWNC